MKVLVLGSGGREHALAWRISKDASVREVFLHPGNAGTWHDKIATLGDIGIDEPSRLIASAREKEITLVVIGPEVLLAKGYADAFREAGFAVVGPGVSGARLETSKAFAKQLLTRAGIPTAKSVEADSPQGVRDAVGGRYPIVVKLDGLAAGKGVMVALTQSDTEDFIDRVWNRGEFGAGPHKVVVEEFLAGKELSYIGLCDGNAFVALSSASDYKRLLDGNQGPNTGGMGVISPSPLMTPQLEARIREQVVTPTLSQLQKDGIPYRGALYFGLMISAEGTPYVLEFNARFGDPETQALMLRVQEDFTLLLKATADGRLSTSAAPVFAANTAVYVVAATPGYPTSPRTGDLIEGVASLGNDVTVFYSGVSTDPRGLVTHGGRVLGVGALGADAESCRQTVYSALSSVRWPGIHYRRDIGTGLA